MKIEKSMGAIPSFYIQHKLVVAADENRRNSFGGIRHAYDRQQPAPVAAADQVPYRGIFPQRNLDYIDLRRRNGLCWVIRLECGDGGFYL